MSLRSYKLLGILLIILGIVLGIFVYPNSYNNWIKNTFGEDKLGFPEKPFRLGLDLQGGVELLYEADLSQTDKEDYSSAMAGLKEIIERRINIFGVRESEIEVITIGSSHRLAVKLPGVKDPEEAVKEIGKTPFLEFREPKEDFEEIQENNKNYLERGEGEYITPFQSTELTGRYLTRAEIDFHPTTYEPLVNLVFDDEGSKLFEELTEKHIGMPLAIYIDDVLISFPVVREKISGGKAQISGDFTAEEARELALNLNAGALPIPIQLISQKSVGATLGMISVQKSLKAGIIGFLLVIFFLILFYRLPGILASLALFIYGGIVLSLFKLIPVTLTLAGIGGFILSIGMAVDANILIFSRMKEERKEGRELLESIREGFSRAWPSIRDGNLTTLLIAIILFFFGTSFVKGFATTLTIGILVSMFSAILVTRTFLNAFAKTKLSRIKWFWG